ncbi:Transformation/transcription domain-associated protein [Lamellibrachia satsuma]|nr:Transformation/transcription domain-associated protein [Lamellibrachia satsuma]
MCTKVCPILYVATPLRGRFGRRRSLLQLAAMMQSLKMLAVSPQDPATQINTFKSYVALIADPSPGLVEKKLKAAQELSENFEMVVTSPQYAQFLQEAMKTFLKILQEGEPQFIAEHNSQQLRKLLLEIIHRIPTNDHLKLFIKPILSIMFKLLESDNEENVLVCLRIIIELHKQYRPQISTEVHHFLQFVKNIYKQLPTHLHQIFEPKAQLKVKDIGEVNVEAKLRETFTVTTIMTEKKNVENQAVSYNLIPKADLSLKVLAELPIIVVLMYQLYKQHVHNEVAEFIPLIMNTIVLQPSRQHRLNPAFNKEVFVDFIAAQIKTLSFLAYIVRIYQENVSTHSTQMVEGMLGLLSHCPQEVAHLRKELLIAARHILATDLRNRFVRYIDKLFDENVLIGTGWTTHESLRPLAYSTLADLVHHVRQNLSLNDLSLAVNLFSKNVHDESLPSSIQTMSCKLLLNLVECIRTKSDTEGGNGRELFMRMLEVFVLKFKTIAEIQMPMLLQRCRQPAETKNNGNATAAPTIPVPNTPLPNTPLPSTPLPVTPLPAPSSGSSTPGQGSSLPSTPTVDVKPALVMKEEGRPVDRERSDDQKTKIGQLANQTPIYTVNDCRNLVKTLVSGVKTITWGTASCKAPSVDEAFIQNKQFLPKETLVYVRLVKYALQALDIYTINMSASGQPVIRPTAYGFLPLYHNHSRPMMIRGHLQWSTFTYLYKVYYFSEPLLELIL